MAILCTLIACCTLLVIQFVVSALLTIKLGELKLCLNLCSPLLVALLSYAAKFIIELFQTLGKKGRCQKDAGKSDREDDY